MYKLVPLYESFKIFIESAPCNTNFSNNWVKNSFHFQNNTTTSAYKIKSQGIFALALQLTYSFTAFQNKGPP